MWLISHFTREPFIAALSHRVTTGHKKDLQRERKITTYFQVASYLMEAYATNDIIDEARYDAVNFKKLAGMTSVSYSDALMRNVLRCGRLNDKSGLQRIFIEGLDSSI